MNSKNICSEMLIAALFVRAKVGNNLNACQWKNSEIMTIFTIHLFKKMIQGYICTELKKVYDTLSENNQAVTQYVQHDFIFV